MKTFNMKLTNSPFQNIKRGDKDIELRLYDDKRKQLSVGDEIIFTHVDTQEEVVTNIEALLIYPSFDRLISDFNLSHFGDNKTKEDLLNGVSKYYSQEDQERSGVLGIKISLKK